LGVAVVGAAHDHRDDSTRDVLIAVNWGSEKLERMDRKTLKISWKEILISLRGWGCGRVVSFLPNRIEHFDISASTGRTSCTYTPTSLEESTTSADVPRQEITADKSNSQRLRQQTCPVQN
jgi:hypothetical protein